MMMIINVRCFNYDEGREGKGRDGERGRSLSW